MVGFLSGSEWDGSLLALRPCCLATALNADDNLQADSDGLSTGGWIICLSCESGSPSIAGRVYVKTHVAGQEKRM